MENDEILFSSPTNLNSSNPCFPASSYSEENQDEWIRLSSKRQLLSSNSSSIVAVKVEVPVVGEGDVYPVFPSVTTTSPKFYEDSTQLLARRENLENGNHNVNSMNFSRRSSPDPFNSFFPSVSSSSSLSPSKLHKRFQCHRCSAVVYSAKDFDDHMGTHLKFQCAICGHKADTDGRLRNHIQRNHSAQEEEEDNATSDRAALASLVTSPMTSRRSNGGRVTKKCRQCGYEASSKEDLWSHKAEKHLPPGKQVQSCPHCPFKSMYRHHFDYHMDRHLGIKRFQCSKCNYRCLNNSMLKSHLNTHTSIYRFRCRTCGYGTKYMNMLNKHLECYAHVAAPILNPDGSIPEEESREPVEKKKRISVTPRKKRRREEREGEEEKEDNVTSIVGEDTSRVLTSNNVTRQSALLEMNPELVPRWSSSSVNLLQRYFNPYAAAFMQAGFLTQGMSHYGLGFNFRNIIPQQAASASLGKAPIDSSSSSSVPSGSIASQSSVNNNITSAFDLRCKVCTYQALSSTDLIKHVTTLHQGAIAKFLQQMTSSNQALPSSSSSSLRLSWSNADQPSFTSSSYNTTALFQNQNKIPEDRDNKNLMTEEQQQDSGCRLMTTTQFETPLGSGKRKKKRRKRSTEVNGKRSIKTTEEKDEAIDLSIRSIWKNETTEMLEKFHPLDSDGRREERELLALPSPPSVFASSIEIILPRDNGNVISCVSYRSQPSISSSRDGDHPQNQVPPLHPLTSSPSHSSNHHFPLSSSVSSSRRSRRKGKAQKLDLTSVVLNDNSEDENEIISSSFISSHHHRSNANFAQSSINGANVPNLPNPPLSALNIPIVRSDDLKIVAHDIRSSSADDESSNKNNGTDETTIAFDGRTTFHPQFVASFSLEKSDLTFADKIDCVENKLKKEEDDVFVSTVERQNGDDIDLVRESEVVHERVTVTDVALTSSLEVVASSLEDMNQCQHCRIYFGDTVLFNLHMGFHNFDDPLRCNQCGRKYPSIRDFFLHIAKYAHPQR